MHKHWPILLALLISFFLSLDVQCMETDNFTGRNDQLAKLPDSTNELDAMVNLRIMLAIQSTNNSSGSCDEKELIRNLRLELNRNPVGEVERFAEFGPSVKRYLVPWQDSIYGKIKNVRGLDLTVKTFVWGETKASSIRLNQQIIGTDKLGHFFSQGYEYLFQKDWHSALLYGASLEDGVYGKDYSGVYSYGDLNANFNGYLFWKSVTGGSSPYVACVNGRYVQKKKFTWKTYVSAAWDEGINCSEFVSKEYKESVEGQERALGLKCPLEPKACQTLVQHPCAFYLVSDACFKAAGVPKIEKREACAKFVGSATIAVGQCQKHLDSWSKAIDKMDEAWGIVQLPMYKVQQTWIELNTGYNRLDP